MAPLEADAVPLDLPDPAAVAERHDTGGHHRVEHHRQVLRNVDDHHVTPRGAGARAEPPELAHGVRGVVGVDPGEADDLGRGDDGRELLFGQARVVELVPVPTDAVAGGRRVGVEVVDHLDVDPERPKVVLVPLERPPERLEHRG